MPLQSWVARFVVENGRVTEEGGLLRTFRRRRLDERDVDLYILAEPEGGKADDLGAQAIENVGRLFLEDNLSVTGGLTRALRSTHQTLLDWNRRSVPRDQVTTGVTAALVSDNNVYICQAGAGLAYSWTGGRLRRLRPGPDGSKPLGESGLEPEIRGFQLQAGDIVIGASESLLAAVSEETLADLLSRGADEALPEIYLLTRDAARVQFFAVICMDSSVDTEPDSAADSDANLGPAPTSGDIAESVDQAEPPVAAADEPPSGRPAGVLEPKEPLDVSRPVLRLRTDQAMSPARYPRTTGPAPQAFLGIFPPRLVVAAAVIAVLALLALLILPDLVRESRGDRVAGLIQQAEQQLAAAAVATEPGNQRLLLEEASSLASEALRLDPLNPAATSLRDQAVASLNTLNAVVDLGTLTPMIALSGQVTGDVAPEQLELSSGMAYILDTAGGRVLAVSLLEAGEPLAVFSGGETYAGVPAQAPVLIVWEGSEQDGRLLVLDAERKLFSVRPGSLPEPLTLRRTSAWSSVAALETYEGNLYVLDPAGGQVHRYFPAGGGFDSEPGPALAGVPSLGDAIGLDVTGDILVLQRDGAVKRFELGVEVEFSLAGIDRPLQGPSGIVSSVAANEVFIVDAGNKRLVVADMQGAFLRQFVSNDFTELVTIALNADGTQLYVISGDTLFTVAVPR